MLINGKEKEVVSKLKQIPLLGCLSEEILADTRYCRMKKYKKREVIFDEVSVNEYVYIVVEGLVKIYTIDKNGKVYALYFAAQGDYFGDPSAQTENFSAATVRKAVLVAIPKSKFKELMRFSEFSTQFFAVLLHRQRMLEKTAVTRAFKRSENRLSAAFEIFSEFVGNGMKLIDLTDEEIGEFCFMTREGATRARHALSLKKNRDLKKSRKKSIVTSKRYRAKIETRPLAVKSDKPSSTIIKLLERARRFEFNLENGNGTNMTGYKKLDLESGNISRLLQEVRKYRFGYRLDLKTEHII